MALEVLSSMAEYHQSAGAENFLLMFRKVSVDRSFMPRISEASL